LTNRQILQRQKKVCILLKCKQIKEGIMKKINLYRTDKIIFSLKYLSIFLLFVLINSSCLTQESKTGNKETMKNHKTKLVKDFIALWETGDTSKTPLIFTEDCAYTDVANEQTFNGIEGVNRYVGHVHNWGSDIKMTIRNMEISDEMGYVEWTFTANQTSPIKGRVLIATNKQITLDGVTLVKFSDDKIKDASDYMDVLGFVLQLGSKVELPGGVILGK